MSRFRRKPNERVVENTMKIPIGKNSTIYFKNYVQDLKTTFMKWLEITKVEMKMENIILCGSQKWQLEEGGSSD